MRGAGALLLVAALAACADPTADRCVHDPPLTYDDFGRRFLDTYCAGCHSSLHPAGTRLRQGAPAGVDFDTYRGLLEWADRVEARATGEAPTMPPGGGPTGQELANLAEWLGCAVADDVAALEEQGWPE
jgi:uncharacterized membrane protein